MMSLKNVFISILLIAIATYFTRLFPFLFFSKKEPGPFIKYLEKYIPPMIMVILIFYSIKDVSWFVLPFGIPELFCILLVFVLHIWKNNPLLSVFIPTIIYMYFVQTDIISTFFK